MGRKTGVGRLSRTLLYEQVAEQIAELIRKESLWESYLPAERELAASFGVSQVTVRRGLELLVHDGLIVRRHGQGTRVLAKPVSRERGSRQVVVAAQWTDVSGGYLGRIMSGLSSGAGRSEWNVSFRNLSGKGKAASLMDSLRSGGVGGLVLLSVSDRRLAEDVLRSWNGPAVLVDHFFEGLPLTTVNDDGRAAAREVTGHLLSCGHTRIAYLECSNREQNPWRYDGLVEGLEESGVCHDERLVVQCRGNVSEAQAAAGRLLDLDDPPTAIIAFDSQRARGACEAAEERGLEVGKDIALACFGFAGEKGMPEGMTCYEFDWQEIGGLAAAELEELMAGKERSGELVSVPGQLVVRRSSRAPRGGNGR